MLLPVHVIHNSPTSFSALLLFLFLLCALMQKKPFDTVCYIYICMFMGWSSNFCFLSFSSGKESLENQNK